MEYSIRILSFFEPYFISYNTCILKKIVNYSPILNYKLSTKPLFKMKHFSCRIFALSFILSFSTLIAQTTHNVNAGSYYFTDITETVYVGDQVCWFNDGGYHDVNFAASYGNPQELVDQYLSPNSGGDLGCITFNTAGSFTYDCSIGNHADRGMVATITVVEVSGPALTIQGILDLNASGGDGYSGTYDGKAIHVRATSDIADLSIFGLGVSNNGGGSDGQEYTFPSISVSAGEDILVYRAASTPSTFWTDYFGDCYSEFEHTLFGATNFPDGNGDDPVELFENGEVIDNYGDVDGSAISGDPYEDGWAYRLDDGSWLNGGEDCDVESPEEYSVLSSGCPYPLCAIVSGCTDQAASNYSSDAQLDDGHVNMQHLMF